MHSKGTNGSANQTHKPVGDQVSLTVQMSSYMGQMLVGHAHNACRNNRCCGWTRHRWEAYCSKNPPRQLPGMSPLPYFAGGAPSPSRMSLRMPAHSLRSPGRSPTAARLLLTSPPPPAQRCCCSASSRPSSGSNLASIACRRAVSRAMLRLSASRSRQRCSRMPASRRACSSWLRSSSTSASSSLLLPPFSLAASSSRRSATSTVDAIVFGDAATWSPPPCSARLCSPDSTPSEPGAPSGVSVGRLVGVSEPPAPLQRANLSNMLGRLTDSSVCSTLTVSCRRASCWWRLLMPPSKAPMRMLGSRAGAASAARSWWLRRASLEPPASEAREDERHSVPSSSIEP
mmetsp:Transcript_32018/g.95645  ORF Transcript_32018/g.95645 Transcript_32018/m.95645 type:complete len:344 (-) Transcript_32018:85-1116(-)